MNRSFLLFAAIAGGIAVLLGALATHTLKTILSANTLAIFETAVRYQFYHVFALFACGLLGNAYQNKNIRLAGYFFITGMLLFCGSLYLLTFLQYKMIVSPTAVGILTPLGGVFFIAGWIWLAIGIARQPKA